MTFIAIDGKTYVLAIHNDPYGNEHPPDTVATCDGITTAPLGSVTCTGGKQLYSCQ